MALTRRPFAARLFLVVSATVLGALGCAACSSAGAPPATEPNPTAALVPAENRAVSFAESAVAVHLPTTRGRPAPTLASGAFERPLRPHQVVGFLPYWEVGAFTPGFSGLTTLAYWSVSLAAGGSIDDKGQGYSTLSSADLGLDVLRAHEAGVRVLLSVFSESNSVIASVSAHPSPAGRRLAAKMATLLRAGGFDGVDLDIEGDSTPDRKGFVQFVAAFAKSLRSMDRRWSVVIDTYPSSAYDPEGFFDIRALAPYVDQFFVMAYDMQEPDIASATAPLTDAYLNDALTLAEYTSVVPATKIVLGIPLYGIDFPTTSRQDGAETTGTQVVGHLPADSGRRPCRALGPGDRDAVHGLPAPGTLAPDLVRRSGLDRPQDRARRSGSAAPASASGSSAWRGATHRYRPRSWAGARP